MNELEEILGTDIEEGSTAGYGKGGGYSSPVVIDIPAIDEYNKRASQINKEIDQEWIDYKNFQPSNAKPYGYFDSGGQWQEARRSDSGVWMTPEGGFAMPTIYGGPEKPREYMKPITPPTGTESSRWNESQRIIKTREPKDFAGEPKAPKLDFDITASNGRDRKVIPTFNEYEISNDIVGAVNGGDLPRLLGQTNSRGETIPTMEIKSKDASGNIRTERVGIDKVNAIYFDQMMDIIEQAQDTQGRFDWNKQSYKNKLKDQMSLWGLNYDNRDERETLESQLRFVAQSKPIVTKNASGQWNYVHMDGRSAPYDIRGTNKSYTVGYKDETTGEFKQLQLSADGENPIMPYNVAAIRQAIRASNPNLNNVHTLQYSVAPNRDIIRDTFYNGLIPFTMKMLTKQNTAETTTLNISNTPRAKEDITKGLSIIMYRYGLNRIYGRRGR